MRSFLRQMKSLFRYRPSKMVRPWALSAPILVIITALPLLRPLRYPAPSQISDEEMARLATVQAVVEHGILAIDGTDFTTTQRKIEAGEPGERRYYSDQTPTMSVLLSGAYWIMRHYGLTFASDGPRVAYLLTLLGVTVPAACAAGLMYRMGRLFELRRPLRAALAAASVLATGLISYATVLNPHAPAATLVLASAACLIHLHTAFKRGAAPTWLAAAGFCAALAAVIDPSAIPFPCLFIAVILSLHWKIVGRLAGVLAYAAGAALPIALHVGLTMHSTGDIWQGVEHGSGLVSTSPAIPDATPDDEIDDQPHSWWASSFRGIERFSLALFGDHGVLSHFPVLMIGLLGVAMVMHRHWPTPAKVLASATVAGGLLLVIAYTLRRPDAADWRDAMFASRWSIVSGPLTLLWAGAWLRRSHAKLAWAGAAVMLLFSVTVSLIGAIAGPFPSNGFDHYTAAEAASNILHPTPGERQVLATR